jgi:phospholipase/lecithinase/hemolysin/uncharacterized protein YhjY with autotransporter beta-barrel domain
MLAAAPASAQRVDRIVAFGDSYADDGNLFQLLGISPPPQPYPTGRFSGGTNYVDTMAQRLSVPVDNFAIGGAFTGAGNINGPGIPGFTLQYQSYLAGGGPAAFPRTSPTFGANDLLVVSIGGNDARAYELGGGSLAGVPAAAAVRVSEATTGLNALVGAGARNITFLAGDVGRLPEVRGTPVAAVGTAYSTAFNTGIQTTLAGYAAQGVTVHYLDLTTIGTVVENNLAAFGLTSAGACPVECVSNTSLQSQYLFYVDRVHLTSAGFAIVGEYAVRQLEAPLTLHAQGQIGLKAASGFGQLMSGRLDLAGGNAAERPLSFFLVATGAGHDGGGGQNSLRYDHDAFGVAGGVEYGLGSGVIGLAVAYSQPKLDLTGAGRVRSKAYHVGAYGRLEAGGAFGQVYVGIGKVDHDIRRRAVIDEIAAEADGTGLTAGGEIGYLFDLGGIKAGPVIGAQYSRAKLDGYTESGDPVLTLSVSRQRASETIGFAGVEVNGETEFGGIAVRPFVKLAAEKELDGNVRAISYAATVAPGIVNGISADHGSDDVYGRLDAGASLGLIGRLSLEVQATATFERPERNETTGFVGIKLGL